MKVNVLILETKSNSFLFPKKETFELYYNVEENRLYYKDKSKEQPTKRDLIGSLQIFKDVNKRALDFNFDIKVAHDDVINFANRIIGMGYNQVVYGTVKKSSDELFDVLHSITGKRYMENNISREKISTNTMRPLLLEEK